MVTGGGITWHRSLRRTLRQKNIYQAFACKYIAGDDRITLRGEDATHSGEMDNKGEDVGKTLKGFTLNSPG